MAFLKKYFGKVVSTLEEKKINYLIIDPRNNYDVDEKSDNRNLIRRLNQKFKLVISAKI